MACLPTLPPGDRFHIAAAATYTLELVKCYPDAERLRACLLQFPYRGAEHEDVYAFDDRALTLEDAQVGCMHMVNSS
jgi:hypothetical protein